MLCDDVLIENHKYGCVIMQKNGAMKIVNFTHVQRLKPGILSTVAPPLTMNVGTRPTDQPSPCKNQEESLLSTIFN